MAQKGNGPGAANVRPAKKYTDNAADFIAVRAEPHAGFSGQLAQLAHVLNVEQVEQHDEQVGKIRRCDRIQPGAEKHHGIGVPTNRRNSRALHRIAAFQFLTPSCAGRMASFMAGRVGASARVRRFLLPVRQPHTACRPNWRSGGRFTTCSIGAIMANPRTTAPATGTLGNSPAFTHTNTTPDTQAAKARKSAALCYVLAVMVMVVTGWFIVEGVAATEPESPTRHAKVAAGILLLVLEMAVFSLAGRWRELSPVLRALGWSIFVLQVVLMSLTQIATGLTAGKTASLGTATVDEVKAQADASRQAAKALLADAEKMRSSKNAWVRQQAGQKSEAAAQQTAAGADALAQLKQLQSTSTATPVSEMIGKPGLIALSIALSLLLELAGVTLMHCAGTLRRRADGAVPVDVQILELLQRIHGAPVAPVQAAEIVALAPAQSVAPVAVAPALASFRQAGTVAPKDASSGFSYSSKTALAGAGLLAATVAPMAHSAPAVPAAGASAQSHSGASEQSHSAESQRHDTGASGAAEMPGQSETEQAHSGATEQAHPASPKAGKTDAPKRAWTATAVPDGDKLDSAVSGKGATRYNRVKTAVRAGKLKPSMRAIQLAEGGGGIVVRRYLQALEKEGVIVKSGRGFVLASKTGGEA